MIREELLNVLKSFEAGQHINYTLLSRVDGRWVPLESVPVPSDYPLELWVTGTVQRKRESR